MILLVFNYLGVLMMFSSVFFTIPMMVAFIYGDSIIPFVIAFFSALMLGFVIKIVAGIEKFMLEKDTDLNLSFSEALLLSALALISLSFFSSIIYLFVLENNSLFGLFVDAFFEAVSGYTTTGLTIIPLVSTIPKSILFFRAMTQWIGGIGIVIMFVFLVSKFKTAPSKVRFAGKLMESNVKMYLAQGFSEKIEPSLKKSAQEILMIYITYTMLGIIALFIAGLPLFEAITICFTAIATGGFIVSDAFYSSPWVLGVIIILMILGACSFIVHDKLFKKRIKDFLFDYRFKVFFAVLGFGVIILLLTKNNFLVSVFQLTSAITGTGFSVVENNLLPPLFILFLVLFMIIGGMLGSTCGGIKISRFYIGLKSIPWFIKRLTNPSTAVIPFKLKKDAPLEDEQVMITYIFIGTYVCLLVVSLIIFLILGYGFLDSSFQVTSALGTVGLSTMSLVDVPIIGKLVLTALMLFGRLEIFPIFVVLKTIFKKIF